MSLSMVQIYNELILRLPPAHMVPNALPLH